MEASLATAVVSVEEALGCHVDEDYPLIKFWVQYEELEKQNKQINKDLKRNMKKQ